MGTLEGRLKLNIAFVVSVIALIFLMIIAIMLGAADVGFKEVVDTLFSKIPFINEWFTGESVSKGAGLILWKLRIPRVILAANIGAGLSVVGAVFQGVFKNPMADPFVLGVSSGGALGATIAIVLGSQLIISTFFVPVFAFVGALITIVIIFIITRLCRTQDMFTLLLAGVAMNFFSTACVSIIMFMNHDEINKIVLWNMGSLAGASWQQVLLCLPFVLVGILVFLIFRRELNAFLLGDEHAQSFGIPVKLVRKILIIVSALIIGVIVSISGIIGFVGLIIPHITRLIVGSNYKVLLPFSIVYGAAFLVLCDTVARLMVLPSEMPVGSITAVFGAPFFIFLLIKNRRGGQR